MSFIADLKRRNVIGVAAAYVIVGWLILEADGLLAGPAELDARGWEPDR